MSYHCYMARLAPGVAILALIVGGAAWGAASSASEPDGAVLSSAVACPKAGVRYESKSASGKKNLCFTLSRDAKKLLGAIFFVWGNPSCSGTPLSISTTRLRTVRVRGDGSFAGALSVSFTNESIGLIHNGVLTVGTNVSASATFKAAFRGTRLAAVSLTVEGKWTEFESPFGLRTFTCKTGTMRWTARRVGS